MQLECRRVFVLPRLLSWFALKKRGEVGVAVHSVRKVTYLFLWYNYVGVSQSCLSRVASVFSCLHCPPRAGSASQILPMTSIRLVLL